VNEERLVAALFNASLQSIALVFSVVLALRALKATNASTRCAVWSGVVFITLALPLIDYATARSAVDLVPTVSIAPSVLIATTTSAPTTMLRPVRFAAVASPNARTVAQPAPDGHRARPPAIAKIAAARLALAATLQRFAPAALRLWLLGIALFGVRFVFQMARLIAAKHTVEIVDALASAKLPPMLRSVRLGLSDRVAVPCVLGLFRPIIALPRFLASQLPADDLQRIVLHESAHVARWDDWYNFVEQLALIALFFNPALYYIVHRIGVEREIACDDQVIAKCHNRITYAQCLTDLARHCTARRALSVPGFLTTRHQILVRVEQILDRGHDASPQIGAKAAGAIAVLTILGIALSQVGLPVLAASKAASPSRSLSAHASAPVLSSGVVTPHGPGAPTHAIAAAKPVRSVGAAKSMAPQPVSRTMHKTPQPLAPLARKPPAVKRGEAQSVKSRPISALAPARKLARRLPADNFKSTIAPLPKLAATNASPTATESALAATASSLAATGPEAAPQAAADSAASTQASGEGAQDSLGAYDRFSVDEVIELHDHGVTPAFIAQFERAGYGNLAAEQLVRLFDHGVLASFAGSMAAFARQQPDVQTLINLRDHDVSATYANSLALSGLRAISFDQLIQLRDHGISAAYLSSLARLGYDGLSAADAINLRDHGVTASYVQHVRRDLNSARLSVAELIRLRDSGI